jgi:hypothetical protein
MMCLLLIRQTPCRSRRLPSIGGVPICPSIGQLNVGEFHLEIPLWTSAALSALHRNNSALAVAHSPAASRGSVSLIGKAPKFQNAGHFLWSHECEEKA